MTHSVCDMYIRTFVHTMYMYIYAESSSLIQSLGNYQKSVMHEIIMQLI